MHYRAQCAICCRYVNVVREQCPARSVESFIVSHVERERLVYFFFPSVLQPHQGFYSASP